MRKNDVKAGLDLGKIAQCWKSLAGHTRLNYIAGGAYRQLLVRPFFFFFFNSIARCGMKSGSGLSITKHLDHVAGHVNTSVWQL